MRQIRTLSETEMYDIHTRLFPEAFPKDEIRPWHSILRQMRAGAYEGWGLYEDGQLYSYAFFFCRGSVRFLDYLATLPAARGKGLGGEFLCQLQAKLAPAMIMGEVEVPDGGQHDALRLRRMRFYTRHGFVLEPVKSRVYGVEYRIITYGRPAAMRPAELCGLLRAIYRQLLASRLRTWLHVRVWQEEPEF